MPTYEFAEWLNAWLRDNHKKPADLARSAHVSQSAISGYLSGVRPRMETLARIAQATGISEADARKKAGYDPNGASEEVDAISPRVRELLVRMTVEEQDRFALRAVRIAVELLEEIRHEAAEPEETGTASRPRRLRQGYQS